MKQYIVQCTHCRKLKTIVIRGEDVYGKRTMCFYCHKSFSVNRESLLRQIDYGKRITQKDYKDLGFEVSSGIKSG